MPSAPPNTTERLTVAISRRIAAVAAACAIALPLATSAQAQPAVPASLTEIIKNAPVGNFSPIDELGRPSPEILKQIEKVAQNPNLPEKLGPTLERIVGFFRGDGKPGVEVPENGPDFTQFGWPTIAGKCIGGESNAVGMAMAVPGPAALPLPGVGAGETSFVFTALGTGTAAEKQNTEMKVHWVNVQNGKFGTTPLSYNGINPEGPTTVNGTAKTGSGYVVALLEGGVTTTNEGKPDSDCNFLPTAAIIKVP